jgi:fibronectin type 3 domain-containing protein
MKNLEKRLLKLLWVVLAFVFSACAIPFEDIKGTPRPDASAIPVPQNLSAQTKTASRIDLAWQDDPVAASYAVYRSTAEDGDYTAVATITENSYTDNSVSADNEYFY